MAATAVIGALMTDGHLGFILCTGVGAIVLVIFGVARSALKLAPYPSYWW